jgi:hypothetical protein
VKPTDAERDPAFDRLIARGLEGETDVSGRACPDADLLAAWFDRSLSSSEAERIEVHASGCAMCQQILADLARSEPAVVRAAPVPEPGRPWHWHWRWLVPVVTVLVVVVVVGNRTLRAPAPPTMTASQAVAVSAAPPPPAAAAVVRPSPAVEARPAEQASAKDSTATTGAGQSVEQKGVMARADSNAPLGGMVGGVLRPEGERPAAPAAAPVPPLPLLPKSDEAQGFTAARMTAAKPAEAPMRAEENVAIATPPGAALAGAAGPPLKTIAMKVEPRTAQVSSSASSPSGRVTWRVGAAGSIDRSMDGRATWQPQASGVSANLATASAVSETTCWAAGAGGIVVRTVDGSTWKPVTSPTGSDILFVRAISQDAAVVRASDGSEYSTTDGGKSWTKRQ